MGLLAWTLSTSLLRGFTEPSSAVVVSDPDKTVILQASVDKMAALPKDPGSIPSTHLQGDHRISGTSSL